MNIDEIEVRRGGYKEYSEDLYCTETDCQVCKMLVIESNLIAMFRHPDADKMWLVSVLEDVIARASFEDLQETKQTAITAAIAKHGGNS